jgi:hypothetical protein
MKLKIGDCMAFSKGRKLLAAVMLVVLASFVVPVFAWHIERPAANLEFNVHEDSAGSYDEASVGLGVEIFEYKENNGMAPFNGRDGLMIRAIATANTRKGIIYGQTVFSGLYDWVEAVTETGITGDNSGAWFTLPFPVRFYGGPGYPYKSAEYNKVWVSSNGFLSFDTASTSADPAVIPNGASPNTLLAVCWSDLDPTGGSIRVYSDYSIFVVLWDNVLNKRNGVRQTFEVIIEDFQVPSGGRGQNRIRFLYESVTWSGDAIVGIEDQEGYKGTMPAPSWPQSGQGVMFYALKEAPEIKQITLNLQKSDTHAIVLIDQNYWSLQGHNVKLDDPLQTGSDFFESAAKGYGSLLVSSVLKYVLGVGTVGGLIISATLVTIPLAIDYVRSLSPLNIPLADIHDAYESDPLAYIKASADTISALGWPVDASVGSQVFWVFNDDNNLEHSLSITAEVKYYSYITNTEHTLSVATPVTLTVSPESEFRQVHIPVTISGSVGVDDTQDSLWYFLGGYNFWHKISLTPYSAGDMSLTLYDYDIYSGSTRFLAASDNPPGQAESITEGPFLGAYTYRLVKVTYKSGPNIPYNLHIYTEPYSGGGGGGGGGGGWPPPRECMW